MCTSDAAEDAGRFHTSLLKATEGNKSARQDPPHQNSQKVQKEVPRALFYPLASAPAQSFLSARARRYDATTIVKIEAGRRNTTYKKSSCAAAVAARQRGREDQATAARL